MEQNKIRKDKYLKVLSLIFLLNFLASIALCAIISLWFLFDIFASLFLSTFFSVKYSGVHYNNNFIKYKQLQKDKTFIDKLFEMFNNKELQELFNENALNASDLRGYINDKLLPEIHYINCDKDNVLLVEFHENEFKYAVGNRNIEEQDITDDMFVSVSYEEIDNNINKLISFLKSIDIKVLTYRGKDFKKYEMYGLKKIRSKYPHEILGKEFYLNGVDILQQLTENNYLGKIVIQDNGQIKKVTYIAKSYNIQGSTYNFKIAMVKINEYVSLCYVLKATYIINFYFEDDVKKNKIVTRKAILDYLKNNPAKVENAAEVVYSKDWTKRVVIYLNNNIYKLIEENIHYENEEGLFHDNEKIETYVYWHQTGNSSITDTLENSIKLANEILHNNND